MTWETEIQPSYGKYTTWFHFQNIYFLTPFYTHLSDATTFLHFWYLGTKEYVSSELHKAAENWISQFDS